MSVLGRTKSKDDDESRDESGSEEGGREVGVIYVYPRACVLVRTSDSGTSINDTSGDAP